MRIQDRIAVCLIDFSEEDEMNIRSLVGIGVALSAGLVCEAAITMRFGPSAGMIIPSVG